MNKRPNQRFTVAVIDVGDCRTAAGRHTAGRYADRRLGGQTLPVRMARRLSESTRIDRVVITGAQLPTSLLTAIAAGVDVLELPYGHVCERLAAAADRYNADWVVYVPGNRPFVDPALVDCLINRAYQAPEAVDYVGYSSADGNWDQVRHLGVAGEVCHADALRRLRRNVDRVPSSNDERCLADWLSRVPGHYEMRFVPIPGALDHCDLRFAIEDEHDWERAEMFSDSVRDDSTEWQTLAELVRHNETLRGAMAQRNQFAQSSNST